MMFMFPHTVSSKWEGDLALVISVLLLIMLIGFPIFVSISCQRQEEDFYKNLKCTTGERVLMLDLEQSLQTYEQLQNGFVINKTCPYCKPEDSGFLLKNYTIVQDEYKDWVGHVQGGFGKSTTHGPIYKIKVEGEICQ